MFVVVVDVVDGSCLLLAGMLVCGVMTSCIKTMHLVVDGCVGLSLFVVLFCLFVFLACFVAGPACSPYSFNCSALGHAVGLGAAGQCGRNHILCVGLNYHAGVSPAYLSG